MNLHEINRSIEYQNIRKASLIPMKTLTQKLVHGLKISEIGYCHWKSNINLGESLSADTDIDFLIERNHAGEFRNLLNQLGFRPAINTKGEDFPSVEHHYALDESNGKLVHVHAYYQVITGDSLTKNYRFPIEKMLLENTREEFSVRVPVKSAELVIFTLRIMLKHTSLTELFLLFRYWSEVEEEIKWLRETDTMDETLHFVEQYLPTIDSNLFAECIESLTSPAPLSRRILLAYKLRSQISNYARESSIHVRLEAIKKFAGMAYRRITHSPKHVSLRTGGAVIAFVGSEATGKSTLLSQMESWLGEHLAVEQIHVGKPKSTALTALPNLFLPFFRSLFPRARTTHVGMEIEKPEKSDKPLEEHPLLFIVRSALVAYDRWAMLSKAYRQAANGKIILCDRYPSVQSGAIDSPQLSHLPVSSSGPSVRKRLADFEARYYKKITAPDLVIYLRAPLEVTLSRNAARSKFEPVAYVKRRHARSSNLDFGNTPVKEINTDQPFEQTVLEVKKAIWENL